MPKEKTTSDVTIAALDSSNYHQLRSGLKNSQIRFERDEKGRVAFLGGSITYNPGWRDSVTSYLQTRFPDTDFDFVEAGIPSMGTTPAAFRLERDVLSRGKIDLLFEEAAVNDQSNGRTTTEQIRGMEGIVRHLRNANPDIDIVMMHLVDPDKMESYNSEKEPQVIVNHESVARHYDISTINLAKEVTDRINNEEFTWEDDFINLHPSPFGQGIYAHSIIDFLSSAYASKTKEVDKITSSVLPNELDNQSYDNGHLLDISQAEIDKGWHIDPKWQPNESTGTRPNYVDVPMLISEKPGSTLQLEFDGDAVGIAVAAGKDAGQIEYRIDQKDWIKLNLFTKWSKSLHLPWYYTLATGLSEEKHVLELRVAESQDDRSVGNACRIRYFFVDGHSDL